MQRDDQDKLLLKQLEERKTEQTTQRSIKAEFSRLGDLLKDIGVCLTMEKIPIARIINTMESIKSQSDLIDCTLLLREIQDYEKRQRRLYELEEVLKNYL